MSDRLVNKREFMAMFNAVDVTPYDDLVWIGEWNAECDTHDKKPALHGSPRWRVDKKVQSPYINLMRVNDFLGTLPDESEET